MSGASLALPPSPAVCLPLSLSPLLPHGSSAFTGPEAAGYIRLDLIDARSLPITSIKRSVLLMSLLVLFWVWFSNQVFWMWFAGQVQ